MGLFSQRLQYLRKKERLTQQDLAQKIGVAKSTISQYEKGSRQPNLEMLEKIADFFNVDIDYLMGRDLTQKIEYTEKKKEEVSNHTETYIKNLLALFAGEDFTPKETEEIKNYIEFIKSKREK